MADQQVQAAAQPAQAAAQPAQTQQIGSGIPSGYRAISDADFERLTRAEQQANGMRPFYDRASKLGFKKAEDFDAWAPAIETFAKKKMNPAAIASMFSPDADADLRGTDAKPQNIDIDELRKQIKAESLSEVHGILYDRERANDPKILEATLKKMLGDGEVDEYTKELNSQALENYFWKVRKTYPDDHPLRGRPMPLTDAESEAAIKHFADLKAKQAGQALADKAKQASKTPTKLGTITGGGASAPSKPTNTTGRRPDGKPTKEAVMAAYEAQVAGRGGG